MKFTKRALAALLSAAMMTCAFAGCGDSAASGAASTGDAAASTAAAASGDKVVKIGVYEPASGDNGAGGKQETLGIQYANKVQPTVEIGGETYTVQLDIVDNQSSTDKGPSAAQQLVSDGVSVVLGSYGSAVAIAAGDVFRNGKVPALGVTCTNPQVTEGNDYYFRICFLDPFQGTVLANFAYGDLSAKKAYCLSKQGDDYSAGVCNYFKEAFQKLGGEVVEEAFPDGNSDFTSYVTNAKSQGCDVFFAPVSIEAAANIIKQAQTQGLDMPISRPVPCLPGVFKYGNPQKRIHLTEKPLLLMRDVVKITEPGGHILDPFAGSGTTVLAAVQEGYRATGIEMSDYYAQAAKDRLEHETAL